MHRDDVAQVVEVDREAFPTEWPPTNFARELENRLAYYIVACEELPAANRIQDNPTGNIRRRGFWGKLAEIFGGTQNTIPASTGEPVIGYAGMWIMADEAHVMSIASREQYRGRGVGEALLIALIDLAARHKARIVTLEVRVSNTTAQNLYTKYGFQKAGVRKGYYLDNKEDAIIMTTDYIGSAAFQERMRKLKEAQVKRWGPVRFDIEKSNADG
jgi:ribosomal-protein-alanine N-acetyltransferase